MSIKNAIRCRTTIAFLSLLSLAVAGLCWIEVHFAIILRDRARSNLITFISVQSDILTSAAVGAFGSSGFALYGAVMIAFCPRWLREHKGAVSRFAFFQIMLAFIMIGIGGYTANRISGFRTAFEKFSDDDGIPYYNIIYFGSAAQAAYGSSLIALVIILALVLFASDAFTRKRSRAQAATEQTEAAGSVVATDQTLAAEDIEKGVSDV